MAAPSAEVSGSKMSAKDVVIRYLPVSGCASGLAFSLHIMNPSIYKSLFAQYHVAVANGLWLNAHVGIGVYIFNRRHLAKATSYQRVLFGTFATVSANFGMVLFWATTKVLLPKCSALRMIFGLASGVALMAIGREYVKYVDSQVAHGSEE